MKTVYILEEITWEWEIRSTTIGVFEDMVEAEKAKEEYDKYNDDSDTYYDVKEYKVYSSCLDFFEEK